MRIGGIPLVLTNKKSLVVWGYYEMVKKTKSVNSKGHSMFYLITFPKFTSIIARDLSPNQIREINRIKSTMSNDEYAGYSPEELKKRMNILIVIGSAKLVDFNEI